MMHFRPETENSLPNINRDGHRLSRKDALLRIDMWQARVIKARRTADESLLRVQDAPEPHITTNTLFVALFETHQRDREALFEAMRQLDAARMSLTALDLDIAAFVK